MGIRNIPHIKIVKKNIGSMISVDWLSNFWSLRQLELLTGYKPSSEPYLQLNDLEVANILEDLSLKYYHPLALAIFLKPLSFEPGAAAEFLDDIYDKVKTIVEEQKTPANRREDGAYQIQVRSQFQGNGTPIDVFIDDVSAVLDDSVRSYSEIKVPNANGRDMLVLEVYEDGRGRHLVIKKMLEAATGHSSIFNSINAEWHSGAPSTEAHLDINSGDTMAKDLPQLINCLNFLHDLA